MDIDPKEIKTLDDFDKVLQQQEQKSRPGTFHYTTLSLIFPPVGLYKAWKHNLLQFVLPNFTIIVSLLSLINIPILYASLSPIKNSQEIVPETVQGISLSINVMLIALILSVILGLLMGIYFRKIAKNEIPLSKFAVSSMILLTTLQVIFSILISLVVTQSIYTSVSDFSQQMNL